MTIKPSRRRYCRNLKCHKYLKPRLGRRFFCSEECRAAFEETYISPYAAPVPDPLADDEREIHALCKDCLKDCKVWAPLGDTPTVLVCPQTLPGFDRLAKVLPA